MKWNFWRPWLGGQRGIDVAGWARAWHSLVGRPAKILTSTEETNRAGKEEIIHDPNGSIGWTKNCHKQRRSDREMTMILKQ